MSDNESAAVSTSPTGVSARWSVEEESLLLLQVMKQILDKDVPFAVNFPQIVIDGRTSRGIKNRWADLRKKAKNYVTADLAAALPKQNTAVKKMSAAKVNDEGTPKKKEGKGAAGGRKIAKSKATMKKETDEADNIETSSNEDPTPAPKKQGKAAKNNKVKKKERELKREADGEEVVSDSEAAPPSKVKGKAAKNGAAKKNEKDADDNESDTGSNAELSPATKKQKSGSPNPRKRKAGQIASIFGPAKTEKGKEAGKEDNADSEEGDAEAAAVAEAVPDDESYDEA